MGNVLCQTCAHVCGDLAVEDVPSQPGMVAASPTGPPKTKSLPMELALDDIPDWLQHLRRRRALRLTGGQLVPAALCHSPCKRTTTLTQRTQRRWSSFGKEATQWMPSLRKSAARWRPRTRRRLGGPRKIGNVCLSASRSSLFFEGLYSAFPLEAASTMCLPFDPTGLDAVAQAAVAPAAHGQ